LQTKGADIDSAKHGIDFEKAKTLCNVDRLETPILCPGEKRYPLVTLIDALD